jgi:hypothetical protein
MTFLANKMYKSETTGVYRYKMKIRVSFLALGLVKYLNIFDTFETESGITASIHLNSS